MKQLLILSGKGGTGKTTVASAFAQLAMAKAAADCDVDAPNLHLVMQQQTKPQQQLFYGLPVAVMDTERCLKCGKCVQFCRFNAIKEQAGRYMVNPYACEGCGVCVAICPQGAVAMQPDAAGETMLYLPQGSVFSTARLHMGKGTSGMLVTEVKKAMRKNAPSETEIAIIDGSPGIGCPVIASLSGVDMVLLVAEPSVSGISDMKRIIETAQQFHVPVAICINKHDTNPEIAEKIEAYCFQHQLPFTGRIPYDRMAVEAINFGHSIVDITCEAGVAVREVYKKTVKLLEAE